MASSLFLINYLFHLVVRCNRGYFTGDADGKFPGDSTTDATESKIDSDKTTFKSEEVELHGRTKSWLIKDDAIELRKDMFKKQIGIYMCFSTIIAILNLLIQVWGRFAHHEHILGCSLRGY